MPPLLSLTGRSTRTPTQAMPSAFSWPVSVPSALRAPAPVNWGVRLFSCAVFEVTLCSTYGMHTPSVSATHNVREHRFGPRILFWQLTHLRVSPSHMLWLNWCKQKGSSAACPSQPSQGNFGQVFVLLPPSTSLPSLTVGSTRTPT